VHSWDWDAHRFIETEAEAVLSKVDPLLDDFLSTYHSYIYSWCVMPDQDKSFMPDGSGASGWHYLDADDRGYDPLPYQGEYDGDLPWAMKLIFDNIVQYLKDENWVTAAQLMGAICHFTGDATMPLHSTYDYWIDGMHTTFEGVADQHINEISIPDNYVPQYLDNITNAALVTLAGSFDFTDEDPNGGVNLSDYLEVGTTWNDWIKSMTENRIRVAVQFTANVWYTAFVQAGILDQSPSPPPSTTPDYTPYIVGAVLAVVVIGIALVLYVRRH
jgi:hypothetical protein